MPWNKLDMKFYFKILKYWTTPAIITSDCTGKPLKSTSTSTISTKKRKVWSSTKLCSQLSNILRAKGQWTLPTHKDRGSLHTKDQLMTPINHRNRLSLPFSTTIHPQQYTLITHLQEKTKAYLTAINTALPSQLHQSTGCCPLKMPATETGEMLGRTTFRTWPKSPKNPEQPFFFNSLP